MRATFILLDDLTFNGAQTIDFECRAQMIEQLTINNLVLLDIFDSSKIPFPATSYAIYTAGGDPLTDRFQYAWCAVTGGYQREIASLLRDFQVKLFGTSNYHTLHGDISQCTVPSDLYPLSRDIASFTET